MGTGGRREVVGVETGAGGRQGGVIWVMHAF